jgi:hypothetical protein
MNGSHILRRAALLTATVGLAGTALLGAGGTAFAAPGPDWDHEGNVNHHGGSDRSTVFEPRHPRQARHWDDDLERCNPSSCWRGFGGHLRDGDDHHHRGHSHEHGDD